MQDTGAGHRPFLGIPIVVRCRDQARTPRLDDRRLAALLLALGTLLAPFASARLDHDRARNDGASPPKAQMIEAIKIWNEPNNLSHWDFQMDPEWREFAVMTRLASDRIRSATTDLPIVLGGMSPIDPVFIRLLRAHGVLDAVDVVAVHGFPLDWNHWQIDEWPDKIAQIEAETQLPVWVTEVGASSFGAEEVQLFGLRRTIELLKGRVERVFWYSLLDLPPTWEATTRHKESEGSSYYRHFYMGLVRDDRSPKLAAGAFDPALGICQWFHFDDPRLDFAVEWLRRLGVTKLRTGLSWADRHRPNALAWFDRQMDAITEFDVTLTLCFTPPSRGRREHYTSPPIDPSEFADFVQEMVERYATRRRSTRLSHSLASTE